MRACSLAMRKILPASSAAHSQTIAPHASARLRRQPCKGVLLVGTLSRCIWIPVREMVGRRMAAVYISCDLCGPESPRFVLNSPGLDGPLVECSKCGFRYIGNRRSALTFGHAAADQTAANVRAANKDFRYLRLEEERRLALLNARWRLDLIRKVKPSGKLLEVGCARGDFLTVAREYFDASGVEPNPELAESASRIAPVHRDTIERTPWMDFDIVASFHVIEHVDSPRASSALRRSG